MSTTGSRVRRPAGASATASSTPMPGALSSAPVPGARCRGARRPQPRLAGSRRRRGRDHVRPSRPAPALGATHENPAGVGNRCRSTVQPSSVSWLLHPAGGPEVRRRGARPRPDPGRGGAPRPSRCRPGRRRGRRAARPPAWGCSSESSSGRPSGGSWQRPTPGVWLTTSRTPRRPPVPGRRRCSPQAERRRRRHRRRRPSRRRTYRSPHPRTVDPTVLGSGCWARRTGYPFP